MIIDGIEQAISLYSFTQRLVERREYGVSDMFAELNSFGISKYELIGSQVFEQYPRPAAREIDAVLEAADSHGVTPFSYGGYIDSGRVTGRIPGDSDIVLDLTADLMTARDLRCSYLRSGEIPLRLLPLAAGLAENYGVKIGVEVHAPHTPGDAPTQAMLAEFERIDSPWLGFIPDFGCFIERPSEPALQRFIGVGASRENLEYIIANRHSGVSADELIEEVERHRGGGLGEKMAISEFFGYLSFGPADVEGFKTLLSRVHYFHSKFYHITEDLTDPTIPVDKLLAAIVESGFQGILLSEYEGHAFYLDDAHTQLDRHLRLEQGVLQSLQGVGAPA